MLNTILPFIALILVVVFIHEYGHYYFAKKYGVGVTDFSIGFGKEIFGWNDKSGTRWKICWIPLGGYVKFFGDRNVFSQADQEEVLKKLSPIGEPIKGEPIVSDSLDSNQTDQKRKTGSLKRKPLVLAQRYDVARELASLDRRVFGRCFKRKPSFDDRRCHRRVVATGRCEGQPPIRLRFTGLA